MIVFTHVQAKPACLQQRLLACAAAAFTARRERCADATAINTTALTISVPLPTQGCKAASHVLQVSQERSAQDSWTPTLIPQAVQMPRDTRLYRLPTFYKTTIV